MYSATKNPARRSRNHFHSSIGWATFRRHKAAIKLHTLLTLQGNFPSVIIISTGSVHDVNILDQLVWEAGAFYIMDRGYLDFARWHRLHQ
jgi:hypothetical protein